MLRLMLSAGGSAPNFALLDGEGKTHSLMDFKGKTFVLYFYPKDDTPGCTTQACQISSDYSAFKKLGVQVLGVSPDNKSSHQKFAEKFSIPFPLLIDETHEVAEQFGAWGEKSFMGKTYMGIIRSTFIIKDGKIVKVYAKVAPDGHSKEILDFLSGLN